MELQEEWELVDEFYQLHDDINTFSLNSYCVPSPTKTTTAAVEPLLIPMGFVVDQQHKEEEEEILGTDGDPISRVSFKKMKETEYVFDMKIDSPKSNFQIDEKVGKQTNNKQQVDNLEKSDEEDGFNLWTWGFMYGFAAICSFGLAAACVCITTINKNPSHFQIHSSNKVQIQSSIHQEE